MITLETAISDLSSTLNEGYGIETTEDALFAIVDMIRDDEKLKDQFLKMVENSFKNRNTYGSFEGGVPLELVELATHELKWPEFAILADKRIQNLFGGDESLAIGDASFRVKEAYADDWEDREFFQRYAK